MMLRLLLLLCLAAGPVWGQGFQNNAYSALKQSNLNMEYTIRGGDTQSANNAGDPTTATPTAMGAMEGDIVISACLCTQGTSAPATCAHSGPAGINSISNQVTNTTGVGRMTVYSTIITNANKGTGIQCTNPGANTGGTTLVAIALRPVDPVNVTDATTTNVVGSSTNPNPASITTVTNNAAVVITCSSVVNDTTPGDSTNYATATPGKQTSNQTDTNPGSTYISWRLVPAAGVEDAAAVNAWTTGTWACSTIALKPWR